MMRKLFFIFLAIMVVAAMNGISHAAEGYVNIGIGKLDGDNTYRIGGKFYGPGKTGVGEYPFPISELAFAAGFQSIPDFNRVFKRRTRMSPSQFRRKHYSG